MVLPHRDILFYVLLMQFPCAVGPPIDPVRGSIRPGLSAHTAPRGAAVNTGLAPPRETIRSGLDGRERGVTLDQAGAQSFRVMVLFAVRYQPRCDVGDVTSPGPK